MSTTKSLPSVEQQLESLRSYGVEAYPAEQEAGWRVQKGDCVAFLTRRPDGLHINGQPGILLGDEVGQLLDGGYQKFLVTPTRKVPATAEHLLRIHAFQETLTAALGEPSLYNESLGTVSMTYHYDRVKGRANP